MKKALCLVLVLSFMTSLLVGCAGDNRVLYDALFTKDYLNVKTASTINLSVTGEGFPEGQWPEILNSIGFKGDATKIQQMSEDYKSAKLSGTVKGDYHTNDVGYYVSTDIWMDMDFSDPNNVKLVQIFRIPDLLKLVANKDYFIYDFQKLLDVAKEISPEVQQPDLSGYYKDYDVKAEKDMIAKAVEHIKVPVVTNRQTGGNKEFTVKLDAKQAMAVANDYIQSIAKSEYLDKYLPLMFPNGGVTRFTAEGVIDKFFEEFSKINYISDRGATLVFTVNPAGELISYSADIEFRFSIAEIMTLVSTLRGSTPPTTMQGTVYLSVGANGTMEKLGKDEKVVMPEINEENSIDLANMLLSTHKYTNEYSYNDYPDYNDPLYGVDKEYEGYRLYRYGLPLWRIHSPIIERDGVVLVPVREAARGILDSNVVYDDESKNIWITPYAKFKEGSNTVYVHDEPYEYSTPAQYIDDQIYVPIEMVLVANNLFVEWHDLPNGKAGIIHNLYIY